MNTQREARRDAREYARAQMFYGEGAGTRRKLISATVDAKSGRDPKYARVFRTELARQDMAEHAAKARRERARTDALESTKRNTRALLTGNYQNAQAGVMILILLGYAAHQTGLDKKMWDKAKEYKDRIKNRRVVLHVLRDTAPNNNH